MGDEEGIGRTIQVADKAGLAVALTSNSWRPIWHFVKNVGGAGKNANITS